MTPKVQNSLFLLLLLVNFVFCENSSDGIWTKEQLHYLENLKREIEYLKETCKQPQISTYGQNTEEIHLPIDVPTINEVQPIAFYAQLSQTLTIGDLQTVEYDVVRVNVGNGYDKRHGHFTAPVPGLFYFSFTVMSFPDKSVHMEIVKNGAVFGNCFADSHGYESGTSTVITQLDQGDMVWVRHVKTESSQPLHPLYNSFTGFLIART
uniref:Putative C1q domain containing protein MgC1q83 n=1 Tax=Mytilus galloprovincialis TaxID=29158 RepID=F0V4C0_MYTGA|nr:putative C1q domain containing protein MgC1q83 [Mytilus galloprovincialis]